MSSLAHNSSGPPIYSYFAPPSKDILTLGLVFATWLFQERLYPSNQGKVQRGILRLSISKNKMREKAFPSIHYSIDLLKLTYR